MGTIHRRLKTKVNIYGGDNWDWDTFMEIYPKVVRIHQKRGAFYDLVVLDADAMRSLMEKYGEITHPQGNEIEKGEG